MKPPYRWHRKRGIIDADGCQALQILSGTESRNKFGPHLAQVMNDLAKAQGTAKEAVSTLGTGSDASEQVNRLLGHAGPIREAMWLHFDILTGEERAYVRVGDSMGFIPAASTAADLVHLAESCRKLEVARRIEANAGTEYAA